MGKKSKEKKERELSKKSNNPYFQYKMREYAIKHPTLVHIVNSLGGI